MIKKCVLPVAGFGTRFLPVTKSIPKEMLPILSKPLIEYAVTEAFEASVKNFCLIINEQKKSLQDYFRPNKLINSHIKGSEKEQLLSNINKIVRDSKFVFSCQTKMSGLGDAISYSREFVNNEPFAVILPDDLCYCENISVLSQMIAVFQQYPEYSIIAVEEVKKEDLSKYGVISGKPLTTEENIFLVNDMIEKPSISEAPSNLAIIGRYILQPEIFHELELINADINGEKQLTDALLNLARQHKVLAYKFSGKRLDCGTVGGFVDANIFFRNLSKK